MNSKMKEDLKMSKTGIVRDMMAEHLGGCGGLIREYNKVLW